MLTEIFFILVYISRSISGSLISIPNSDTDTRICQPDCDSKIYCVGQDEETEEFTLLHDVQMNDVYHDGTEFVKKKMKYPENEILRKYDEIKQNKKDNNNVLSKDDLLEFVNQNFEDEILLTSKSRILEDFKTNANNIRIIKEAGNGFQSWLLHLNSLWKKFARKMPERDGSNNELSSYIYVPNTFIVAGGRFDEMYYWDSYWIIKGLLACEMYNSTRGIIENFIHLVKIYGYVPNGNRIYYQKRSQPPMLIQMANAYYEATKDDGFIKNNLQMFEKEFRWWYDFRRVQVRFRRKDYHLFRYHSISCFPRPESYKEDYKLLMKYAPQDVDEAIRIYTGIRSAAESGWDFSSRHMRDPTYCTDATDGLINMNSGEYAYVELNSIMYSNVKILADWKRKFGNKQDAYHDQNLKFYERFTKQMLKSIENVLWNDTEGIWLDYDLFNGKHRNFFYASNLAPLWSKTYINNPGKVDRTIDYLQKNKIINEDLTSNYYGVPTSDIGRNDSMQQWDFPNVWAPLQSFIIRGLKESNNARAEQVALNLATAFVNTAYVAYCKHKEMYEKYDATNLGKEGGKGEYKSVTGFGWTNGFIFELFTIWKSFHISSNRYGMADCQNESF